jgi:hypothetical protein
MASVGTYRIRWANVSHGDGRRITRRRMCIAERRNWLCWWPVSDAQWYEAAARALVDIERDKELRSRLPSPIIAN